PTRPSVPTRRSSDLGRPLRTIFNTTPDLTPYVALKPAQDLNEKNPLGPAATESAKLDFSHADAAVDETLNRILWRAIKGETVPRSEEHTSVLQSRGH